MKCQNDQCRCTHQKPCEAGWIWEKGINYVHGKTKDGQATIKESPFEGVRPCPTCDPDRDWIFNTSKSRDELMRRLQERSSHKQNQAYERGESERTRTL